MADAHMDKLAALEQLEKSVGKAYSTGRADRSEVTRAARENAEQAVDIVDKAMQADIVADETERLAVIAEGTGVRANVKAARKNAHAARKEAKIQHKAATKSAKEAYDAVRFSSPNKLGFMRVIMVLFAYHIVTTLLMLILTSRDMVVYNSANMFTWVSVILEGVAFWLFINRYKVAKPFVIIMGLLGIAFNAANAIYQGRFDLLSVVFDSLYYLVLVIYFATSKRVKATMINDISMHRGAYESENIKVNRRSWPFWRNCIMYFFVFSVLGHWMEAGLCQFIRLGLVEGKYNAADTVLWRDWFYPFPMEGMAVVLIALFLYPLFAKMREKFRFPIPYILSFLSNAFLCTAIEFTGGMLFNRDLQMWDYSDHFGNFMGQVCLQNTLAFGVAASIITWFVYPTIERWLMRMPEGIVNIMFVVISVIGGLLWSLYIIQPPDLSSQVSGSAFNSESYYSTQKDEAGSLQFTAITAEAATETLSVGLSESTLDDENLIAELKSEVDEAKKILEEVNGKLDEKVKELEAMHEISDTAERKAAEASIEEGKKLAEEEAAARKAEGGN